MPITPYTGSWGPTQRLHLIRRTLFGARKADIAYFSTKTMSEMVTELLNVPTSAPPPPLVDYTSPNDPLGTTWVNGASDASVQYNRVQSLRGWWMGLCLQQERNIREKMTFFWHNHIPTDFQYIVTEPLFNYRYLALLRQHCLGNFKDLMRNITIDPAMLVYLDGRYNLNTSPNENYARELQELFCIGKDITPSFTEADVAAAAKVLTGWEIDATTLLTKFTPSRHTTSNKVFSSFYGNTTITGQTGANAGNLELDALLNMIFAHDEVARFVVRKMYRFFVYYDITPSIEAEVIVPLADTFRSSGYNIKTVLESLFTSQHFYDVATTNFCMIKNPLDYTIGLARVFGVVLPVSTDLVNTYKDFRYFIDECNNQQMRPGNPPNVAGWPAYYQVPNFHELWINADTLRKRKDFCDKLLASNFNGMKVDVLAFTATLASPSDPNLLIDEALMLLHPLPSDAPVKQALKNILLSNQTTDAYWTTAWNNYVGSPTNTTYVNTVTSRLKTLYQTITNMAEYHLT
jgi:uncharacterized protein (DUF1800 family)